MSSRKENKQKKFAMSCPYNEHNRTKADRDLPELKFNSSNKDSENHFNGMTLRQKGVTSSNIIKRTEKIQYTRSQINDTSQQMAKHREEYY